MAAVRQLWSFATGMQLTANSRGASYDQTSAIGDSNFGQEVYCGKVSNGKAIGLHTFNTTGGMPVYIIKMRKKLDFLILKLVSMYNERGFDCKQLPNWYNNN